MLIYNKNIKRKVLTLKIITQLQLCNQYFNRNFLKLNIKTNIYTNGVGRTK